MTRLPLVLDCDPGHDDALAIMLASQYADLRAITTVSGNANVDRTTHNALATLQILGADVPVFRGACHPLIVPPHHFPQIHGESGLAGPTLPDQTADAAPVTAVEAMLTASREADKLWIAATGPLTNLAIAD